jgi:ABC-type multidrug transport system fused ATPase/permease subunit
MADRKTKLHGSAENRAVLRRVLRALAPYRIFLFGSLAGAAVSVAAQLLVPILCGDAIDRMLGAGQVDLAAVGCFARAVALAAGASALAQWVLATCNNRIAFCVSRDLRNAVIRKFQTLPLSYLDAHPAGDLVSRMIADVDTFSDGLLMGFTQLFTGVLTIAARCYSCWRSTCRSRSWSWADAAEPCGRRVYRPPLLSLFRRAERRARRADRLYQRDDRGPEGGAGLRL